MVCITSGSSKTSICEYRMISIRAITTQMTILLSWGCDTWLAYLNGLYEWDVNCVDSLPHKVKAICHPEYLVMAALKRYNIVCLMWFAQHFETPQRPIWPTNLCVDQNSFSSLSEPEGVTSTHHTHSRSWVVKLLREEPFLSSPESTQMLPGT